MAFIPTWAQAHASDAVMALVRRNYGGTGAVSAAFDLNTYWSVRERDERRSGELLIAPGDRFRVTLGNEVFVSDGRTFWQYSERNKQVAVRNFSDIDPATLPSRFLTSFLSNRAFTETGRSGGNVELAWRCGGDGAINDGYSAINATVEERTGVIRTLRLVDRHENVHTYTFRRTTFDRPPRDDVFQFRVPRGVEVIDMRENNASD
jgi:outer membrane lipoprotein-sorting protein